MDMFGTPEWRFDSLALAFSVGDGGTKDWSIKTYCIGSSLCMALTQIDGVDQINALVRSERISEVVVDRPCKRASF